MPKVRTAESKEAVIEVGNGVSGEVGDGVSGEVGDGVGDNRRQDRR